eukprot:UN14737
MAISQRTVSRAWRNRSCTYIRPFTTSTTFFKTPDKIDLAELRSKAAQIKEPPQDIGGWRVTDASKNFPETALRAILQEYEYRLRDGLFRFQKKNMPIC